MSSDWPRVEWFKIYSKHLMTGPDGNSEFCFPRISMFPETKSREILSVLSSVLVKNHNFIVFCFIGMSICSRAESTSPKLTTSCSLRTPTNGMESQIVECWLLWEVSSVI